jgi:site-specific DNA-methyltransferase (adenine-specific)
MFDSIEKPPVCGIACGEAIDLLRAYPDDSLGLAVTSPPYNIKMPYADGVSDNRKNYDEWTLDWIRETLRVCRDGLMMNLAPSPSTSTRFFQVMGLIAQHFHIQNSWVWVKSITINETTYGHFKPVNSDTHTHVAHEHVVLIQKDKKHEVKLARKAIGVPYMDKSNIKRFNHDSDLRCRGSTWFLPYKTRQKSLDHPATYPEDFARMMIQVVDTTGIVLDPFVGSGTTMVAAHQLGLRSIGFDKSPTYCEMTRARLEKLPNPPRLALQGFGETHGTGDEANPL